MAAPLSPPSRQSKLARFGVFEADLEARELRKQGRRLGLQEQPFALLVFLLERAGAVVSREELRERLWPADTFVDFDHSLNTAINKLRTVLGDSATNPRFIETLARRGYRFVGEVRWEADVKGTFTQRNLGPIESASSDIPTPHRAISRSAFALIQIMYLVFYLEALLHWESVDKIPMLGVPASVVLVCVLVTAAVGIPVRFYFLSAVAFDYTRLAEKFQRIFPGVFLLDELWAIVPFLILEKIGFGAALAATAALLYVPYAERTLLRMAYREVGARAQPERKG